MTEPQILSSSMDDVRAAVWHLLDAAVAQGEPLPSGREIRAILGRNNAMVLRAKSEWHAARRARRDATTEPAAPTPPTTWLPPDEEMPSCVAIALTAVAQALTTAAEAVDQLRPAVRKAFAQASDLADRQKEAAVASAYAAAEATLQAERAAMHRDRDAMAEEAGRRMAEAAGMAADAIDAAEDAEAVETVARKQVADLERVLAEHKDDAALARREAAALAAELRETRECLDVAADQADSWKQRAEAAETRLQTAEERFDRIYREHREEAARLRTEVEMLRREVELARNETANLQAQLPAPGTAAKRWPRGALPAGSHWKVRPRIQRRPS